MCLFLHVSISNEQLFKNWVQDKKFDADITLLDKQKQVMGKGEEVSSGKGDSNESTSYLAKSTSEASKMLEAALLQMDGILSGAENTERNPEWKDRIKEITRKLTTAIKNSPSPPPPPDAKTTEVLMQWLQSERLRKLENERTSLHMEISILSEQVDVQSSKIIELENALQEKKDTLRHMEESLQKEVLARSALETQKLELLSSLSEMKLRQASLEHENMALRSSSPLTNGDRFSRHAGHYCSLPRPPNSSKKGVVFADEERTVIIDNQVPIKKTPTKPLGQLSIEEVGDWLSNLGLETYVNELKKWGATGSKLIDATHSQIEKELDIKNSLHRKKLIYAIESERSNGAGFLGSDKMDNAAVLHWLDDIGLPQHKEAFHNAKVDGRVLHRLTTDDLLILNVTAQLHAASLRRGIQVLREVNFEFDYLERRSTSENGLRPTNDMPNNQVALWTNHRVMEWLRMVDLAEYAPNMRGSGVHGGLIVYEPRFTSELLATLLSIPPVKTLLRRHLTTHFNEIVGREIVTQKREIENTLGFVPLTLTARLKVPKRTQFTLKRKKSKNEVDFGNLVCPLEASPPGTPPTSTTSLGNSNPNSPTI